MQTQSKGRVLVLEDAPSGQAALAMAHSGFELRSVTKEKDALELAGQVAFDVVVVDLDLPLDGVTLVRRLHEQGAAASVVWITSNTSNELAATAAEVGVVQVLHKSADSKALARVVSLGVEQNRNLFSMLRAITRSTATTQSVPATSAKNEFASVLDAAVQDGAVVITKHDSPKAVLVSIDRMSELLSKHEPNLKALTQEFDEMVARMRMTKARAAARSLFDAPPAAFGEAAVAGAKKHG
jgi:prevent-host-death family protein